jgi:hypothetical protein
MNLVVGNDIDRKVGNVTNLRIDLFLLLFYRSCLIKWFGNHMTKTEF